jgi:excisionase family DNA binding protein
MNSDYISIREASILFGVHPETLRRWDRSGKLKAIQMGARGHRKYRKSEVESYVRNEYKDFYQLHLQFQNYMLNLGYKIRARESLLSPIFPTTFTPSGGPDLVAEFSKATSLMNVIINQPCIRHWDIESVGDNKHLSFFNMFVAICGEKGFSRKEIIIHFLKFFSVYLHLDFTRIHASYCLGGKVGETKIEPDLEIQKIWDEVDIPREKQFGFGDDKIMEAFVANSVEPFGGYRAELFYDLRINPEPIASIEEFIKLDKSGQILEFFTHVEYSCEVENGKITQKIPNPVHASGIGPQRLLKVLEGPESIGNISILKPFRSILAPYLELSEKDKDILVDHVRAMVFLFNDGVSEISGRENRSRRSVFNKYKIRLRDILMKTQSDKSEFILEALSNKAIDLFSVLFPEFEEKRHCIVQQMKENIFDSKSVR